MMDTFHCIFLAAMAVAFGAVRSVSVDYESVHTKEWDFEKIRC